MYTYLVLKGNVLEQIGHRFLVVNATDGLGQQHTDVYRLDLVTLELLKFVRNCVCHHHLEITDMKKVVFVLRKWIRLHKLVPKLDNTSVILLFFWEESLAETGA